MAGRLTVIQLLPALQSGGVERGTLEVAQHLVANGHRSIVVSAPGRMLQELLASGSEHLAWDVGRKRLWSLRWIPRLRRLFAESGADIVHLRSRLPAWLGYLAWRGMPAHARPRLVTTVHGPYSVGRYSAVMTRGERVIAVSETIRRYVLDNYPAVDPARLRVIHRGVDPAKFPYGYRPDSGWLEQWERELPGLDGRFVVTLPARVTRWKGQLDLLRVVAGLRARGVPAHGLIAGGWDRRREGFVAELRQHISAEGLADAVTLLGHRNDLREVMAVSGAVLSLSNEPEAFGRTTVEALAMGVPVAGYDHGGVGEQLAAIFPQGAVALGDVDAMVELLAAWHRARPAVPTHNPFTLERMLRSTLELYLELDSAPR